MRTLLLLLLGCPALAHAASLCVSVSSSGAADGSDWNNALGASFTPVRGNIYYLADGSYGTKTWNTASSGTTLITIRKATASGHVTDTGWSSTMGDGVALYGSGMIIDSDYWTFDGVTGSGRTGHGIEIVGQTSIGTAINGPSDHLTFEHVLSHRFPITDTVTEKGDYSDVTGWNSNTYSHCFQVTQAGQGEYYTWRNCYVGFVFGCPFQFVNVSNVLIEHCFIEKTKNTAAWHSEGISTAAGSSDVTIRWTIWCDIEGTALIADVSTGTVTTYRWDIYGCVFYHTDTWGAGCSVSAGIIVQNDGSNHGTANSWNILNNDFANINGDPYLGFISATGSGNKAHNNLWWGNRGKLGDPTAYVNKCYVTGVGVTFSYNFYSAAACPGFFTVGTGEPAYTAGPNCPLWPIPANTPFVDRANANFNLTTGFAGEMTAGLDTTSLVAGNSVDMYGQTRGGDGTWDRGAIEYPPLVTVVPASVTLGGRQEFGGRITISR